MSTANDLPKGTSVRSPIRSSDPPHLQSAKRRREFHHLLGIIEKNTGGKQPAMASASSIRQIANGNGVDDPRNRLRACIEQGQVVAYDGRVVRKRVEDLRAAIAEEDALESAEQDTEKLERLAAAVREVRDD